MKVEPVPTRQLFRGMGCLEGHEHVCGLCTATLKHDEQAEADAALGAAVRKVLGTASSQAVKIGAAHARTMDNALRIRYPLSAAVWDAIAAALEGKNG